MELSEARRMAAERVCHGEIERVNLEEALGRVLASDISAPCSIPGESRSRFDGFALRSIDTKHATPVAPAELMIIKGLLAAGYLAQQKVEAGQCIRVLTGAPLPEGTDAVVPDEEVQIRNDRLFLREGLFCGSGVASSGDNVREGDLVLHKGTLMTPTRLAFVSALRFQQVPVYSRPVVAILATGDEVRELGEEFRGPWTICNNRHLLGWLTTIQGGKAVHLGVARDDPGAIAEKLRDARSDLIISTGGMGRGERDFILEAWRILGIEVLFSSVNLTPGKRSAFGIKGRQMFWGFPGNPWAAQVVFEELVSPALRRLQGLESSKPLVSAQVKTPLQKKPGFYKAFRGSLDLQSFPPSFTPLEGKEGSQFVRLGRNFAYILLDPNVVEVAAGSRVQVYLHDFPLLASPVFEKAQTIEQ